MSPYSRIDSNKNGFESAVRLMKSLAAIDASTPPPLPITSEPFLRRFLNATRCSGSLLDIRPAVNRFALWLGEDPAAVLAADADTLDRYRVDVLGLPADVAHVADYRTRAIGNLARLLLYLQYQGLRPSFGWGGEDADLCIRFHTALLAHGLTRFNANRHGLHGAHLIIWARLHGIKPTELGEDTITRFATHRCHCGLVNASRIINPNLRQMRRRAAVRLLRFMDGADPLVVDRAVVRADRALRKPAAESVAAYRNWLIRHRGLATSTVETYMNELLEWQAVLGEDAGMYTAARVRALARQRLEGRSPTVQSRFITVIRSYLRFRAGRGDCAPTLADALISRPTYSLGTVPRSLPFETLRAVIAGCDPDSAAGIRDRAMLTLLLETGMRGIEVARLRLQDLDWERAVITVRGKGGRASIMPLTQDSGDAILDWLARARPATDDEALFVRIRTPCVGIRPQGGVADIVCRALARAGHIRVGGSHLFRHSLARKLLKEGVGLPAIAGVLRHQTLDTAMIYAKVDEAGLKSVARPWPGAGR